MTKIKNTIFGIRSAIEAIRAGKDIEKILIQKGLTGTLIKELHQEIREFNIPFQYIPIEKFRAWESKNHQGVIAILSEFTYQDIESILPMIYEDGQDPFILILDQVTDIRNFGAIARTAECAGVHAIIIPEKGNASVNADSIKVSAGALLKIPVCRTKNINQTIDLLKSNGLQIVSATEKTQIPYSAVSYKKPTAIVMGSEEKGISASILQVSDYLISIPLMGTIESLNVSVAAGIILYEAIRQKQL
jgi:23S rRNA (guanosine2251-2'-O)-methyltransferase